MTTKRKFTKSQLTKAAKRGFDLKAIEARRQRLIMQAIMLDVNITALLGR
jgi:hypothetical protein